MFVISYRVFVPGKPFQPCLMFVRKAEAYPSEAPFMRPSQRKAPALFTNITQGWKGLPGTNTNLKQTLVNYSHRKFNNIGPKAQIYFMIKIYKIL